jgi:hypothetical protein
VIVLAEPDQPPHPVNILAEAPSIAASATQTMAAVSVAAPPPRACLSDPGRRADGGLTDAIVNLGRRRDNQIVVDDARVSRSHAQLRLRFGHLRGVRPRLQRRHFVNGLRIEECVLRPATSFPWAACRSSTAKIAATAPSPASHSTLPLVPPATG